jgi:hypothetical protein
LNRLAQAENKIKPFKEKSPQAAINKNPRIHPVFEKAYGNPKIPDPIIVESKFT